MEFTPPRDDEPELLVETEDVVAGRGYQVCIKLNERQQKIISELAGTTLTELRINVDELGDLASVIAN